MLIKWPLCILIIHLEEELMLDYMQCMMIEFSQKVLVKVWTVLCWLHVNGKIKKVIFAVWFWVFSCGFVIPPPPSLFDVEALGISFSYFISVEMYFFVFYVIDPIRHIAKMPPCVAPKNLTDLFINIPGLKQPCCSVEKLLELGKQNTLQGQDGGALRRTVGNTNIGAISTIYFQKENKIISIFVQRF